RDEKAHQAILATALEMARTKNRYRDITIERISQGAKVAKTTIYRWWDSKSDLIHEACFEDQLHDPEPSSLRAELKDILNQAYQMHVSRATRGVMAGLLAEYIEYSQEHPELLNESVFPFERDLNNILSLIFDRGKDRGDGPEHANIRAMVKTIETVLFHNCITYGQTCNEQRMAVLIQQVLSAASLPE
ncbi:MAG: TetR/AcrR family transcriptional regulator, partial [Planctomycetes bacterium]|nr:TetR/AcrR family transcriptional regulator [Planctomycetota bacterium]